MRIEDAKDILRKTISCPSCKGNGFYIGASMGVGECEECGGDGHRLHGMEGSRISDIIENAFEEYETKKDKRIAELSEALEEISNWREENIRCHPDRIRDIALDALEK